MPHHTVENLLLGGFKAGAHHGEVVQRLIAGERHLSREINTRAAKWYRGETSLFERKRSDNSQYNHTTQSRKKVKTKNEKTTKTQDGNRTWCGSELVTTATVVSGDSGNSEIRVEPTMLVNPGPKLAKDTNLALRG